MHPCGALRAPNADIGKARCILSQVAVERRIGKLATDPRFRTRFFANPEAATWEAGLQLSPGEFEALSALSHTAVSRFSESLDRRVSRLCLDATGAPLCCGFRAELDLASSTRDQVTAVVQVYKALGGGWER